MDIPSELFNLSIGENLWEMVKILVLFVLLIYLCFEIVVIRQAQLMTKTVAGELDRQIRVVSWGLFVFTAVVFLGAVIFL